VNKTTSRIIGTIVLLCHLGALSVFGQKSESGKLFEGQSATLYYEIRGTKSGTPLFVINGGPGIDHTYMHSTLYPTSAFDQLAKQRPVIFYDPRGVGKSPALKAGQSCTLADQVADLEALRSFLGYERIDVLGHSFGGFVAMAFAARFPERIAHLVISDSVAPKFADTVSLFERVFPETTERMKSRNMANEADVTAFMLDYFSMLFYSPIKRDAYLAKVTNPSINMQVSRMILKEIEKIDLNPEIAKFSFPTLVMNGRYDMDVVPLVAYQIHKAIPNSRFVVFETSGHLPFYEEQEKFVQSVGGFLSGK